MCMVPAPVVPSPQTYRFLASRQKPLCGTMSVLLGRLSLTRIWKSPFICMPLGTLLAKMRLMLNAWLPILGIIPATCNGHPSFRQPTAVGNLATTWLTQHLSREARIPHRLSIPTLVTSLLEVIRRFGAIPIKSSRLVMGVPIIRPLSCL